jgi:hypothetical protein
MSDDLAFGMDDTTRAGFAIMFASFHGRKFNYDRWDFEDPK